MLHHTVTAGHDPFGIAELLIITFLLGYAKYTH